MLIMNSRRTIFVHLHKCAGSTIECTLAPLLQWNDILLGSTPEGELLQPIYQRMFGLNKHSSAARICAIIGREVWNSYFTFATVRSPYQRVASLYSYTAGLVEDKLGKIGYPTTGSQLDARLWLNQWTNRSGAEWSFPSVQAYLWTRQATRPFSEFIRNETLLGKEPGFRTQFSQLCSSDGSELLVNEVIKTEDLNSTWILFCEKRQFPKVPLVERNMTDKRFRKSIAELTSDPADYKFIADRFLQDFESFQYKIKDQGLNGATVGG